MPMLAIGHREYERRMVDRLKCKDLAGEHKEPPQAEADAVGGMGRVVSDSAREHETPRPLAAHHDVGILQPACNGSARRPF